MKKLKSILGIQLCNSVTLTGDDVVILSDRILADLADGDAVVIDVPNDIVTGKKGKNGNVTISFNAQGEVVDVTLRVLKGSADDKYLNSELNSYRQNKSGYVLLTAEFIKNVGDGEGNIIKEIYTLSAGFIKKLPAVKDNVEGDNEQSVSVYALQFMNANRSMT